MVVVLAPAVENICDSSTHNLLKRAQGNPTFLSLMGIHKDYIANASKFESDFVGGKHGCVCVVTGDQQYLLHSNSTFIHPIKPGHTLAYPLSPTHRDITVADHQYQNSFYDYPLVKNMNSALKKIIVVTNEKQWIKGSKDMLMWYANKYFFNIVE